ncbi:MAG: eCIS core domain-containing protein [Chloroflexota bacterium]
MADLNSLLGNSLGALSLRLGGATRRELEGGRVTLYEGCGGPAGAFIKAINGGRDAAITIGHAILYTRRFHLEDAADRWLLAHERAHVAQAERMTWLYLPRYLVGEVPAALRWWRRRRRPDRLPLHDLHWMEIEATSVANAAVPEAARRI